MSALLTVNCLVTDMERSLRFYTQYFGANVIEDAVVEGDFIEHCSRGTSKSARIVLMNFPGVGGVSFGAMLELIQFTSRGALDVRFGANAGWLPSLRNVTFVVESLDAALQKLRAAGIEPVSPILSVTLPHVGSARVAFVLDPDENLVEVAQPG